MLDLFDLTGKVALVTGASHGLGMSMAIALGKAGATLCINGTNGERLEKAKETYREHGLEVHIYVFDVTNEEQVDKGISKIEQEVGVVDILVNNAGIIKRVPILDMPVDDFRQVLDVDLVSPFIVSKRVAPNMIKQRSGKIINICSMMSELGRNSVSAYAAAKGGLKMLTRNMCTEWAKYNIQVNGIGPGYIATEQTAPIRENGHPFNDLIMTVTPADRWGDPEDLGGTAVFLASKAANFVNGHILYVDGGILATLGYVKGENEINCN